MEELQEHEMKLQGKWIVEDGNIASDQTTKRIECLVKHKLQFLSADATGWGKIYKDPSTGFTWKLYYPESDLQGGGPPALIRIDENGNDISE